MRWFALCLAVLMLGACAQADPGDAAGGGGSTTDAANPGAADATPGTPDAPPGASCGDGTCSGGEDCASCAADCGTCPPSCGDGTCSGGEDCASCAADCGACPASCGDGTCNGGETCATCAADCGACPPSCGDGTCNGTETCSSCASDCGACPPSCGDGTCNGTETCGSCASDCGACPPSCGDGTCNGTETCSLCAADCGACPPQSVCELAAMQPKSDTCAQAIDLSAAAAKPNGVVTYGSTSGYGNHFDPQPNCVPGTYNVDGPDAMYRIDAKAGQILSVTLQPEGWDAALYLVTDCAKINSCLAGVDQVGVKDEKITYTIPATGSYYVIVDSYLDSVAGCYTLRASVK